MGMCTPVGVPFDILTAADLGGAQLSDKMFLVPAATENKAMAHLVVRDNSQPRYFVRSIIDDPTQSLGDVVAVGGADSGPSIDFQPADGLAAGGNLLIFGASNFIPGIPSGVGEMSFPLDPFKGATSTGAAFSPYSSQPSDCQQGGYVDRMVFAPPAVGAEARYLLTCVLPSLDGGQLATLYAGGQLAPPVAIASNDPSDVSMLPTAYTLTGGTHIAFYQTDQGGLAYAYGATEGDLGALKPMAFSQAPSVLQGVFGLVPAIANDGITLAGGFFDMTTGMGQLFAGAVPVADYGLLGSMPPGDLKHIGDFKSLDEIGSFSRPLADDKTLVFAGAPFTGHSVLLDWIQRDGTPLLLGSPVYTTASAATIAAAAAPFGPLHKELVVWIEKDGSSPPQYDVKGLQLLCQM
jgi:hypothetical protein